MHLKFIFHCELLHRGVVRRCMAWLADVLETLNSKLNFLWWSDYVIMKMFQVNLCICCNSIAVVNFKLLFLQSLHSKGWVGFEKASLLFWVIIFFFIWKSVCSWGVAALMNGCSAKCMKTTHSQISDLMLSLNRGMV